MRFIITHKSDKRINYLDLVSITSNGVTGTGITSINNYYINNYSNTQQMRYYMSSAIFEKNILFN